ncbi:hypothetical protein MJO28_011138 [Puccinia striiformis f. sp. tritici]|uniref:Uncharacterized protein n=1 Tax=Puccinia striiformis f. sp. tritici TaxID=168172 RepID=A0ACC0E1P3_9BASI|nr:hypothetical protein MJO28_011138 [Puccinia striiformis f. sp. tritici]KAI9620211.1 hypothetical protein H4Q26_013779 [Puccinia striiformis f. sp. tritici PST-130]
MLLASLCSRVSNLSSRGLFRKLNLVNRSFVCHPATSLQSRFLATSREPLISETIEHMIESGEKSADPVVKAWGDLVSISLKDGVEEGKQGYQTGGYHPVEIGDRFDDKRYQVIRKLGWGPSSTVWLAHDQQLDRHVSLKISKSGTLFTEAAEAEIQFHERTSSANPAHPGHGHIASLFRHFKHEGPNGTHVCSVFEVLGETVTALRKLYKKVPPPIVQKIGRQILLGLDFLHRECGIVHRNLEPGNVLISIGEDVEGVIRSELKNPPQGGYNTKTSIPLKSTLAASSGISQADDYDYSNITVKIAGLSCGTWISNRSREGIVCRPYRSPELFIGAPWDQRVDIWGAGCSLGQLLTGEFVFEAYLYISEEEYMLQVIELVGPYPIEVLKSGKYLRNEITRMNKIISENRYNVFNLEDRFRFQHRFDKKLTQCILRMLELDPSKRWEAKQLLDEKAGWLGPDK